VLPFFTPYLPFTHSIQLDIAFGDSHTLLAQHSSGTFAQLDLRHSYRPIDAIPRASVTWEAGGGLTFVCGRRGRWEVLFDDVYVLPRPSPS
jgi:WD repeat-containing protein 24